jgi:hypothetical protein
VEAVCDGSPSRLVVLAVGARTVRGSGPDGLQPGGRSGAFPACSLDGPNSRPDRCDDAGSSSSPRRT